MNSRECISVIIPIYNTEVDLPQCLDSIRKQTYGNYKVYMVDDGSKDESGAICDRYAAEDERFLALHKENGGPSAARNYALARIMDGYVFFLDSDDYLTEDAFAKLIEAMNGNDMAVAGYLRIMDEGTACEEQFEVPKGILTQKEILYYLLHEDRYGFIGYLFPKLYKATIIAEYGIRFEETIRHNEDRLFVTEYVLHAQSINCISDKIYLYRQRESSLTHVVGLNKFSIESLHELFGFEKMKNLFKDSYQEEWYRTGRLIFEKALYWERSVPKHFAEERAVNRKLLDENFRICMKDPGKGIIYKLKTLIHWIIKK